MFGYKIINHNGEEFLLTKDKLSDFDRNQESKSKKLYRC